MSPYLFNFFNFISLLGGEKMMLVMTTLISFFIFLKNKDKLLLSFILSNYLLTMGLVICLKFLIQKPRNPLALVVKSSYAFPSGHAAAAITTFLLLFYLANFIKNHFWKYFLQILGAVWVILIVAARLYLKVHDPYDILGSLVISVLVFYFLIHLPIFKKYLIRKEFQSLFFKFK